MEVIAMQPAALLAGSARTGSSQTQLQDWRMPVWQQEIQYQGGFLSGFGSWPPQTEDRSTGCYSWWLFLQQVKLSDCTEKLNWDIRAKGHQTESQKLLSSFSWISEQSYKDVQLFIRTKL